MRIFLSFEFDMKTKFFTTAVQLLFPCRPFVLMRLQAKVLTTINSKSINNLAPHVLPQFDYHLSFFIIQPNVSITLLIGFLRTGK